MKCEQSQYHHKTPLELIELAKQNIDAAKTIITTRELLNKLGCHTEKSNIFGSSYFWKSFIPGLEKDIKLSYGSYLFEFLKTSKEIYEFAEEHEILGRLSPYQRESLINFHYNNNDYSFYRRNNYV